MTATTGLDAGLSAVCRMEDLLSAVAAVVPHVGRPKDGGGVDRVRVVVDAGAMRLALLAGDRTSAVVALAPLLETDEPDADGGGAGWVADLDLTAPSARFIPAVLDKAGGDTAVLTVDPIRRTLRVADASGLLEGRAVKVRAMGEWVGDEERVCAAGVVLAACARPLAARATAFLPADALRSWAATGRALGGLPMRLTAAGDVVVAAGAVDDLDGLTVLGATAPMWGADHAPLDEPAYDGPGVTALMGLLLDGVPAGGETAPDRDRGLVGEITDWLHDRPAGAGGESA